MSEYTKVVIDGAGHGYRLAGPKLETPRKGDKVRIVLDGEFVREGDPTDHDGGFDGHFVNVDGVLLFVPSSATVEVLERADDPSKALRGEVREIDGMAAVRYGKDMWVYFSPIHHGATGGYGIYRDEQVVGTPVIGVVPHTPAAEQFIPEWERELIERESAARRSVRVENETHGPRLLRVHPHVWQSLTHYLASTRIRVTAPDGDGVWGMELMDGEWT